MNMIRQSRQVLVADFAEKKIMFNLVSYIPYAFNNTAYEIWDFCKKPRHRKEIVNFLSKKHNISVIKIKDDVKKTIAELKKIGLIEEVCS